MEFEELFTLEESLDKFEHDEVEEVLGKTSGEGFNGGGTFIPVSPNGMWAGCGLPGACRCEWLVIGNRQDELVPLLEIHWQSNPLDTLCINSCQFLGPYGLTHLIESWPLLKDKGHTLLTYASDKGQEAIVLQLLDAGANTTANIEGFTALTLSAANGHLAVVHILCDRKANIEAKDNKGWTALIFSAYRGQRAVVQILCDRKANIEAKANEGRTPLYFAEKYKHQEVVNFLKAKKEAAAETAKLAPTLSASIAAVLTPQSPAAIGTSWHSAVLVADQGSLIPTSPIACLSQPSATFAADQGPPTLPMSPTVQPGDTAAADHVLLKDLSLEQVVTVVMNLALPDLVTPFQRHRVDGSTLDSCIDSFQDLVDLDRGDEIKPVLAKRMLIKLTEWKKNGGQVPKDLLLKESSTAVKGPIRVRSASPPSIQPTPAPSAQLVISSKDVIISSGNSWIVNGIFSGGYFACDNREVKVKIVPVENENLLQHELNVLRKCNAESKHFVRPLHDMLIPSGQFTVSGPSAAAAQFDRHVAMVLEMGEITLTDFLIHNHQDLSPGKLIDIITCLVCMVSDAHTIGYVMMDIKDQNVMQFKIGRGNSLWKGIDLDSSLQVGSLLSESSFTATIRFMAPELLTRKETRARQSMDIWSLGVLIFNILLCKQRHTFWSQLGIYNDDAIRDEVVKGRLTQKKVDDLIERSFLGSDNSSQRHFLQRMLKVEPSERCTIHVLHDAALLKGTSSYSASTLYRGQEKILSEIKSLSETIADINTLVAPKDIKELLIKLDGSFLAADQKKYDELSDIDSCPPVQLYYYTMQMSMNGVFQACTVISSDMVANEKKGWAGYIAKAIGTFSSLADPVPFAGIGLNLLKEILNTLEEQQQKVMVMHVVEIFRGDQTVISAVAEGVARSMALYRKAELENATMQQQPKKRGWSFRVAIDMCLNGGERDPSKIMAATDTESILQHLMNGDLAIRSGKSSTSAAEKAEAISREISAFVQLKGL
eukprot:gene25256-33783_t